MIAAALACSPHLPPTNVPSPADPTLEPFRQALQTYVNQTQPYRKQAAQQSERVPGRQEPQPAAMAAVRTRQNVLADALRQKIRPNAHQGELFTAPTAAIIKRQIADTFKSPKRELLVDELAEQVEGQPTTTATVDVNSDVGAPLAPPLLLETLPPLPKQLEYDFFGRTLIIRDVDAELVVDYLPDALPAQPSAPSAPPSTAPQPTATSFLPLPDVRGGTVFVLIGDSGSGDSAQQTVAESMLTYFTSARRFRYVLMLGDNLYHDDYNGEFLEPYKPLLDRGVTFYAALGNHDRDLEQHFKPFNMKDRDYYSFDQGNARFAVLNSNHPTDPAQLKWLDGAFADAGSKWRIAFFHHPLYSSGQHADQSREVIRPALEPALVRNGVNVAFAGHEHLYERVKPQQGVRYFVSGGGGRNLYDVRASSFDEVARSAHHFMVIEIAGDALFYEALEPSGRTIDCGVEWRTADAAKKGADDTGKRWLSSCQLSIESSAHH